MPSPAHPVPSDEALRLAADMRKLHGVKALGRARMDLYAAVNRRQPEQVALLTQVCHALMEGT